MKCWPNCGERFSDDVRRRSVSAEAAREAAHEEPGLRPARKQEDGE